MLILALSAAKRKREEPSPAQNPKVRKPNPPIGKIEIPPPDLKFSPPKPSVPVPPPVVPAAPPVPVVTQPPQPTVSPVTNMRQYQEKLANIKSKLSMMPRDRLQQSLAQLRATLHGLDASINSGRVHPDSVTQHRLDRQIFADVLKWSVQLLEPNQSSAPSASTSSGPTLVQVHLTFSFPSAILTSSPFLSLQHQPPNLRSRRNHHNPSHIQVLLHQVRVSLQTLR